MKNVSFGKEGDLPIQKKNDEDLSDENELDLEDECEQIEKDNNHKKTKNINMAKQYEEFELNSNNQKDKIIIYSSESEDKDSDKTSENDDSNQKINNINTLINNNSKDNINKSKEKNNIENENNINEGSSDEENKEKTNKIEENSNNEEYEKEEKKDKSNNLRNKNQNKIENEKYKYDNEISKKKEIESRLLLSIKNKENPTSERMQMAEEINFKSIPDKIIETDQFGFIVSKEDKNMEETNNNTKINSTKELLQINARIEKWNYMIEHQEEFFIKNLRKVKSRTRKGIPDCLRSYVWQIFGEKDKYYQEDIFKKLQSIPIKEELDTIIIKDLDRTFPACQFFKDKYGNGQRKLYKVLSNYSKFNTATGYVQGMGFIVAVFLTYMDEESSFFMLDSLMKKYGLEGFYRPNFPKLKCTFYILLNLLKKHVPKVYELFKKEGMIPSMYASEWFICLFSRNLEFNILVRIFDVFLLEGYKVIYRFALAFLKIKEDKFLEGKDGLVSIMQTINDCYNVNDIEKIFKIAFGFSLSRKYIDKLEIEYESIKDDQNNEFVKQL